MPRIKDVLNKGKKTPICNVVNQDGVPYESDPDDPGTIIVPEKECVFEFVDFDPAIHIPGEPLPGSGVEGDPWLVPLKECNFEFTAFDPNLHAPGNPLEGAGTEADPWLIPIKDCNFIYIPYDANTHAEGVPAAGDGTLANPWQIPTPGEIEDIGDPDIVVNADGTTTFTWVITETDDGDANPSEHPFSITLPAAKECEFEFVAFDPNLHAPGNPIPGTGTSADPWLIPVKDCNFVYIPYDATVHVEGQPAAGDGTLADPWQIPVPGEVEDIEVDIVVNADGSTTFTWTLTETDDGDSDPSEHEWQVTVPPPKECVFEFVELDPDVHAPGAPIPGTGTTADPWLIPVGASPVEWQYVDFDPNVHVVGAPPAGDGTTVVPYQIPIADPCKPGHDWQEMCCPEQVFTDGDLGAGGAPPGITSMSLLAEDHFGVYIYSPEGVPVSGSIPVPAATPGCTVFLQLLWIDATRDSSFSDEGTGDQLSITPNTSEMSGFQLAAQDNTWAQLANSSTNQMVYIMDAATGAAGGTIDFVFTNPEGGADGFVDGVFTYHWFEVCGVTSSDFNLGATTDQIAVDGDGTGANQSYPSTMDAVDPATADDCDAVVFGFGRHVATNGSGNADMEPSDWMQPQNAAFNEVNNVSSDNTITSAPCQLGEMAGWLPGGSGPIGFDYQANLAFTTEWGHIVGPKNVWIPLNCADVGGGPATISGDECSVDVTGCGPCDHLVKGTVQAGACITVAPGSHIAVTPVIDGNPIAAMAFEVNNVNGADEKSMCVPINASTVQGATIGDGATATVTASLQIDVIEFVAGGNEVVLRELCLTGETNHVCA